jgi:hypothetical protein
MFGTYLLGTYLEAPAAGRSAERSAGCAAVVG